jgi:hypothetical protein
MERERRSSPRVKVNLPARWQGAVSQNNDAAITDVSRGGCFVLTGGEVEVKELIWLEIDLPDSHTLGIWAEVVEEATEIGFAVRFNFISEEDREPLALYIDQKLHPNPVRSR